MNTKGQLLLFPTLLGENHFEEVLPLKTLQQMRITKYFIVENERTARRFLSSIKSSFPIPELIFWSIDKHEGHNDFSEAFKVMENGENVGLLSEAGCPAVADPGNNVVAKAHQKQIRVVPFTGPSSILLALMASGFNGQHFHFHGYLPREKGQLQQKLKTLESDSRKNKSAQIFIETPYRNQPMLEEILLACQPQTHLCVAVDLTLDTEEIVSLPLSLWKKTTLNFNKRPAIFLLQVN
ncbi:MAG: SAM-dependent methyltransferase [Flavobacteriales bacterium]